MSYVDGFVIPVAKDKVDEYQRISKIAGEVWKENGALDYKECLLDEAGYDGLRAFTDVADAGDGETVIFAFIVYASKEERDAINEKVMADPRIAGFAPESMPFDSKRMAFAGFKTIVEWDK